MNKIEISPVKFKIETVIDWADWAKVCVPRLRRARSLKMPHLVQFEPHAGACLIVGAAPSVEGQLSKIKELQAGDCNITMTINAAHEWLISHGVKPNLHVIFEHDVEDIETSLGGKPDKNVTYYVCSHCHKAVFDALADHKRVLWHAYCPAQGYQQAIDSLFPKEFMVAGGYATFFRSLTIGTILGYRHFELFGVDSSFEDSSHLSGYAVADVEPQVTVWGVTSTELKKFKTQGGLAFQANEFMEFCRVNHSGLRIRVHGDGLLRYLHQDRYPEQYKED